MKIAVTGKGGVGKTTFAATLARLYAEEGRHVLAPMWIRMRILGLALGFSEEELDTIVPISKMRKLVEERTGAGPDNQYYKINPKVDDIPDAYGKVCNGVKLLVLGTVETGGAGCVCPEHVMLRRIINNLVPHRGDVVVAGYGSRSGTYGSGNHRRYGSVHRSDRTWIKKCTDLQECKTSGKRSRCETGTRGCQ